MIKGIDISHNNDVNWSGLGSDIQFVYAKATQGQGFKDPQFNNYWQHLKGTTLYRGAYHFLTVGASAQDQANNFLSLGIDFSKPNVLPPMLDIEDQVSASLNQEITDDKSAFIQLITDWIKIVEEKTSRKVVIYSYGNFFREYLNNSSWPTNPLWLAAYQNSPPHLPVGWNNWTFWQYSEYGTIGGLPVGGEFDLDYFQGTIEELGQL